MVEQNVVLSKVAAIERCLQRIEEVSGEGKRPELRREDVDDIVAVNLQRAAQGAIDLAMHVVATEGYGLPWDLGESFALLEKNGVIDAELGARLHRMVGFRNIMVHQDEGSEPRLLEETVSGHLEDVRLFARRVAEHFGLDG
jgi:uncharacterized protein YutE (UPF0331/DUF86 family)